MTDDENLEQRVDKLVIDFDKLVEDNLAYKKLVLLLRIKDWKRIMYIAIASNIFQLVLTLLGYLYLHSCNLFALIISTLFTMFTVYKTVSLKLKFKKQFGI